MEHYASMFIDDELSLDEKMIFVRKVHDDDTFYSLTIGLIDQEKELCHLLNVPVPETDGEPARGRGRIVRAGWALAAMVVLMCAFFLGYQFERPGESQEARVAMDVPKVPHRFVIQQQDGELVEIVGNFTNWQKLPLVPTGQDGYWEITLPLPEGEHRYSFIVNGETTLPDPTVPMREADGFGSLNSILLIELADGRS